jgi:putative YphP/YqiW family bacilliredoxin
VCPAFVVLNDSTPAPALLRLETGTTVKSGTGVTRPMQIYRYDPVMVRPMRDELTQVGFYELRTPEEVDKVLSAPDGTVLVVVNSVCGCAAGSARPGVRLALEGDRKPDHLATVFAGMELEAVERARSYFVGYPPSSPQIGLFKNGQLVFMLERQDIEGRSAEEVAGELQAAFDEHCAVSA